MQNQLQRISSSKWCSRGYQSNSRYGSGFCGVNVSVGQGPARPKSLGLDSGHQGSGLLKLQAGPSTAQAQAGALYLGDACSLSDSLMGESTHGTIIQCLGEKIPRFCWHIFNLSLRFG
jgi:hypothetical protein